MGKLIIPVIDNTSENSSATLYVADAITDPNFTLLYDALAAIILDGLQQSILRVDALKDGSATGKATNKFAQRETKWLATFRDVNGDVGNFEVPCADLQYVLSSGELDLTAGVGLTLKTQFDALAISRKGLAVTLEKVVHVGRNT